MQGTCQKQQRHRPLVACHNVEHFDKQGNFSVNHLSHDHEAAHFHWRAGVDPKGCCCLDTSADTELSTKLPANMVTAMLQGFTVGHSAR
jgi:hypothetical protein